MSEQPHVHREADSLEKGSGQPQLATGAGAEPAKKEVGPIASLNPQGVSRLTWRELGLYGSGIVAYQYPHVALAQLAMPLFNVGLGLDPATVGGILMVGRLWEVASNPFVGNLSDNTRTRWGRRRPYVFVGGLLTGLIYPLIWFVPREYGVDAMTAYLVVSTLLLYTAFSFFSVPYIALGLELSPEYNERTKVQVWRTYFNIVPSFTAGWFYWFCQRPIFNDVIAGAQWLGWGVGAAIIATSVLPAIWLRERYYRVATAGAKESLGRSIRTVFRNKDFSILTIAIIALELGRFTTDNLGFYVLAYHVYGGNTSSAAFLMGINSTMMLVLSLVAIPCIQWIGERLGKLRALRLCILLQIAADLLKWVLASPDHPWTWVIIGMLAHFGSLGFWILVNSMKADICDVDELATGSRREGTFSAVSGVLQKGTAALTLWLAGLVLQMVGFDTSKAGAQSADTIMWLRVFYSVPSVLFLGLCWWVLRKYKLDATVMGETRVQLERRRSAV